MDAPIIDVRGLRKVYRIGQQKTVALDTIDLQIQKGEICCLLGTSGSGKSTLLNMLAGLEKPSKGSIVIDGHKIHEMNENQLAVFRQNNVGFVFQSYNLMNALTALENVALPLVFKGADRKARTQKARELLEAVGLGDRIQHLPGQMSGGQQQRVGIARAFVVSPKIVFADEPTGNLDSKTTKEVMDLIVGISRRTNITLVLVTHDADLARYADRIVHILDGRVASIETNENPIIPRTGQSDHSDIQKAESLESAGTLL